MTSRKADARLPNRTPSYVSREVGAAELGISPGTWDAWVKDGTLPPAASGFPESTPRWRWSDVDKKLSRGSDLDGEARPETVKTDAEQPGADGIDPYVERARNWRNGTTPKAQHRTP